MSLTDLLIVMSTLLSPLIAIQASIYIAERKEERGRKIYIYKTLMASRAYTLSVAHVEALNRIDLEFSERKPRERKILGVWREYLDLLGSKELPPDQWVDKRLTLLIELLYVMGEFLGYDFDRTQLKKSTYAPVAHGRIEEEQEKLRQFAIELLDGKRNLPMIVTNLPLAQDKEAS